MTKPMEKRFSLCKQEEIEVFPMCATIIKSSYDVKKWGKKEAFYDL